MQPLGKREPTEQQLYLAGELGLTHQLQVLHLHLQGRCALHRKAAGFCFGLPRVLPSEMMQSHLSHVFVDEF